MRTTTIARADMLADVVESMLKGSRVLVVGRTGDDARDVFATITDAFTDDDGTVLSGVTIRKSRGAERIDLPGNGGRLWIASGRTVDARVRGLAVERIYTPAVSGPALLRSFEAATIHAADGVVLEYEG